MPSSKAAAKRLAAYDKLAARLIPWLGEDAVALLPEAREAFARLVKKYPVAANWWNNRSHYDNCPYWAGYYVFKALAEESGRPTFMFYEGFPQKDNPGVQFWPDPVEWRLSHV